MRLYKESINQFLEDIEPQILSRGREYYRSGQIEALELDGLHVTAEVSGSGDRPYQVEIEFSEDGDITDWFCDCPYDWGDVCKHTAAVLLAVQAEPQKEDQQEKKGETQTIQTLMSQAGREQLSALILEHCREDKRFRGEVLSRLGCSGAMEAMLVRELVKESIRANTHHGYIDEWGCDNICADLDECLDKAIQRIQQGQFGTAMEIALFIFLTGMELAGEADSSSGALGLSLDAALEVIGQSAAGLAKNKEERSLWLHRLLDAAQSSVLDGWEGSRYDLLRKAVVLADAENKDALFETLDSLNNIITERYPGGSYYSDQNKQTRYQLIQAVEGPEKAQAYLEAHLESDGLRLIQVGKLMEKRDYAGAEALCLERTENASQTPWLRPSQWEYLLYEIYQKWGQKEQQVQQARKLALKGDIDFYHIAKDLLTKAGRWQKEFPAFLSEYKAARSSGEYMNLLEREGQTSLLMKEVRLQPRSAFLYGDTLAEEFGGELCRLCTEVIRKEAGQIYGRKDYQRLCKKLLDLNRFGGSAEARTIIEELRQTYPRRPALLEELERTEQRIMKKVPSE